MPARLDEPGQNPVIVRLRHILEHVAEVEPVDGRRTGLGRERFDGLAAPLEAIEARADRLEMLGPEGEREDDGCARNQEQNIGPVWSCEPERDKQPAAKHRPCDIPKRLHRQVAALDAALFMGAGGL